MKAEILDRALNGVDDAYIEEAETTGSQKPRFLFAAAAAAACMALLIGVFVLIKGRRNDTEDSPKLVITDLIELAGSEPGGSPVFELDPETLPKTERGVVIRIEPIEANREFVLRITRALGMSDPELTPSSDGSIFVKEGESMVHYKPENGLLFIDTPLHNEYSPATERQLEDGEYVRIALEHIHTFGLDRFESYDFAPENAKVCENDIINGEKFNEIDVVFTPRLIEGEKAAAGRHNMIVILTNDGRLKGVDGWLYDYRGSWGYPLVSAEEAARLAQEDPEGMIIYSDCPDNGVLTSAELYYCVVRTLGVDELKAEGYLSLIPVYVFSGGTEFERCIVAVPAISPEYLRIKTQAQ